MPATARFGPPPIVFDCHVLAFDIAGFAQASLERAHTVRKQVRRFSAEETDHRLSGLLRTRRERPRGGRATDKGDELPPPRLSP